MENGELLEQNSSKLGAAFAKFEPPDFGDLGQRHGAADRMTQKRARVNRLARCRGPRSVHHIGAANAGGKRKAAGECLAETDQVRSHAAMLAGEPFSGAAETGVNL